jgi:hypothetical protein
MSQHSLWVDCLLPSTQEARNRYAEQFDLFCLTRTHVNLVTVAVSQSELPQIDRVRLIYVTWHECEL